MENLSQRLSRFCTALEQARVDVALIPPSRSFVYLGGVPVGHLAVKAQNDWLTGLIVFNDGRVVVSVPKMHAKYAQRIRFAEDVVAWSNEDDAPKLFADLLKRRGVSPQRIGLEEDARAKVVFGIRQSLPGIELVNVSPHLRALRACKDPDEVALIRKASTIQESVLAKVTAELREGVTEIELAGLIDAEMRKAGGEGSAFETIVRFGVHSSWLGPKPTHDPIRGSGPLQIDLGTLYLEYCSDMTRTLHVGPASPDFRSVYDAVLEAQSAALEIVRAGMPAKRIDAAARAVLSRTGHAEHFPHRTGHGIGLDVQEDPDLNQANPMVLAPGMVVTVEPGVYLPERFGVRIEDVVLVGAEGPEFLTTFPRQLLEVEYAA